MTGVVVFLLGTLAVWLLWIWLSARGPTVEPYAARQRATPFLDARLCIRDSTVKGAGYGVFATEDIESGTTIERAHGLVCSGGKCGSALSDYLFSTGDDTEEDGFIAFGYASLYNHHPKTGGANVDYGYDSKSGTVAMTTLRPVRAGEELFIHYGEDWCKSHGVKCRAPGA